MGNSSMATALYPSTHILLQGIFTLRTWAIYQCNKIVLCVLATGTVIISSVSMYAAIASATSNKLPVFYSAKILPHTLLTLEKNALIPIERSKVDQSSYEASDNS